MRRINIHLRRKKTKSIRPFPVYTAKAQGRTMNRGDQDKRANAFDHSIVDKLSELLRHANVFKADTELSNQFSFACVVQDRLRDAIDYLDAHLDPPENNEEFYLFMVYADNVFSAVQEVFAVFQDNVKYAFRSAGVKKGDSRYFTKTFKRAFPSVQESDIPSDDDFFKYFRALSFAHPYETSRQKFIDKDGGERHYSPFPLTKNSSGFPVGDDGDIGIVVYSNRMGTSKSPEQFTIILDYSTVKDFLISRYNELTGVIEHIINLLGEIRTKWLEQKVDRNQPLPGILEQLQRIFKERFEEPYPIEILARHLQTMPASGSPKNDLAVSKYKEALTAIVPAICDAVDNGDYTAVSCTIDAVTMAEIPDWPECPDNRYRGLNYHYGKVAEFCANDNSESYSSIQADLSCVLKGYASKWVDIDADRMSRKEIELLLSAARFLESAECRARGMFPRPASMEKTIPVLSELKPLVDVD